MSINDEATIEVFNGFGQKIEVLLQEEVQLDVNVPLFYIKSGEEEVQAYVDNHAKPQIKEYAEIKKLEIDEKTAEDIEQAKENIETFVKEEVNPSIQEYADTEIRPQLDALSSAAVASAKAAAVSEQNAQSSATQALTAAESAAAAVDGFDAHAAEVQGNFDGNAAEKTAAFNNNVAEKQDLINQAGDTQVKAVNDAISGFDANVTTKTNDFNDNASTKTTAFNDNATTKTEAFNANAAEKQEAIDQAGQQAADNAALAQSWAIGSQTERPEGSAKHWAEQAENAISGDLILNKVYSNFRGGMPISFGAPLFYIEINGNTIILKSGAKVFRPDIKEIITTTEDMSLSLEQYGGFIYTDGVKLYSGNAPLVWETEPSLNKGTVWINPETAEIKMSSDGIGLDIVDLCLPLAYIRKETSSDSFYFSGDYSHGFFGERGFVAFYGKIQYLCCNGGDGYQYNNIVAETTKTYVGRYPDMLPSQYLRNYKFILDKDGEIFFAKEAIIDGENYVRTPEGIIPNAAIIFTNTSWNNGGTNTPLSIETENPSNMSSFQLLTPYKEWIQFDNIEWEVGQPNGPKILSEIKYRRYNEFYNGGSSSVRDQKITSTLPKNETGLWELPEIFTDVYNEYDTFYIRDYILCYSSNNSEGKSGYFGIPIGLLIDNLEKFYGDYSNTSTYSLPIPLYLRYQEKYFYVEVILGVYCNDAGDESSFIRPLDADYFHWLNTGFPLTFNMLKNYSAKFMQPRAAWAAMPSGKVTNLTFVDDQKYTAPADGYYNLTVRATAANQFLAVYKNEILSYETRSVSNGSLLTVYLPVTKGDVFSVDSTAGGSIDRFVFIYANGSAN